MSDRTDGGGGKGRHGKIALRDTEGVVSTGSSTWVATQAVAGPHSLEGEKRSGGTVVGAHQWQAVPYKRTSNCLSGYSKQALNTNTNIYTLWKPLPQQAIVFQFRQEGKHRTSFSYHVQNKRFGQILTKSMTNSQQLQLWILNIDFSQ